MIAEVMDYCNKHFIRSEETVSVVFDATEKTITGTFANSYIKGGYVLVLGSVLNDMVLKVTAVADGVLTVDGELLDEEVTVHLFALQPPRAFLDIVTDIEAWVAAHPAADAGIASEGIDDYSVGYDSSVSAGGGWQAAFRVRLSRYAAMFNDLPVVQ